MKSLSQVVSVALSLETRLSSSFLFQLELVKMVSFTMTNASEATPDLSAKPVTRVNSSSATLSGSARLVKISPLLPTTLPVVSAFLSALTSVRLASTPLKSTPTVRTP